MSRIITRSEVAEQQALDFTHPLAGDVKISWLPVATNATGDVLYSIGSYDIDYTSPSTLSWFSDGVASSTLSASHPTEIDPDVNTDFDSDTTSLLYILDTKCLLSNSANDDIYIRFSEKSNTNRSRFGIYASNYAKGLSVEFVINYGVTHSYNLNEDFNGVLVFYFDHISRISTIYLDGVVVSTADHSADYRAGIWEFTRLGVGTSHLDNRLRSQTLLWSIEGFTTDQIESLASNPYQIFQTVEDVQTENCLVFDSTQSQGVTFPDLQSTNLGSGAKWINYSLTVVAAMEGTNSLILIGDTVSTDIPTAFYVTSTGDVIYRDTNGNSITWPVAAAGIVNDFNEYVFNCYYDGTNKYFELVLNEVSKGIVLDNAPIIGISDLNGLGLLNGSYRNLKSGLVKFVDHNNSSNNRFYDFNQNPNTPYVPDLYGSGNNATLVNFPTQSGYVREVGSHDGVEFDGVNDYATMPSLEILLEETWKFEVELDASGESFHISRSTGTWARLTLGQDNVVRYGGSEILTFTHDMTQYDLTYIVIAIEKKGFLDHTLSINGVEVETITTDTSGFTENPEFVNLGVLNNASFFNKKVKRLTVTSSSNRYYDFTKTTGYTVPDTVGGNDATLVGFSQVYYRPVASERIVGYEFNGVDTYLSSQWDVVNVNGWQINIDFTLNDDADGQNIIGYRLGSGNKYWLLQTVDGMLKVIHAHDWTVGGYIDIAQSEIGKRYSIRITQNSGTFEVEYDEVTVSRNYTLLTDRPVFDYIAAVAQSSISGFSAITIHGLLCTDFDDATNNRDYDFTTGDEDSIIDTVGNNHATIVNTPTSGFMPVVEKQVFTVGSGKDYGTIQSFLAGEAYNTYLPVALLNSNETYSGGFSVNVTAYPANVEFKCEDGGKAFFDSSASGTAKPQMGIWRNVHFYEDAGDSVTISNSADNPFGADFYNCEFSSQTGRAIYFLASAENVVNFYNCQFITENNNNVTVLSSAAPAGSEMNLHDCVVLQLGTSTNTSGAVRTNTNANAKINLTNTLIYAEPSGLKAIEATKGTINDDFCVANDSSLTGTNSLVNQPIDTWLVENNQINTTGQAVLQGAGWNGSNIVEWAWAGDTGAEVYNATVTLSIQTIINSIQNKSGSSLDTVDTSSDIAPVVHSEYNNSGNILVNSNLIGNYNIEQNNTSSIFVNISTSDSCVVEYNVEGLIATDLDMTSSYTFSDGDTSEIINGSVTFTISTDLLASVYKLSNVTNTIDFSNDLLGVGYKRSTTTSTTPIIFDYNGSTITTKSSTSSISLNSGVDGLFYKSYSDNNQVDMYFTMGDTVHKASNKVVLFELTDDIITANQKISTTDEYIDSGVMVEAFGNKESASIDILNFVLDITGTGELFNYIEASVTFNAVLVHQEFNGILPHQEFNGVLPNQYFNGVYSE